MTAHRDSFADTSALDLAIVIDSLCTRFERAWRAGLDPKIEQFLNEVDPPVRAPALRELIALEVESCRNTGRAVSLDEYRKRFPDCPTPVEEGWALAERSRISLSLPLTASYSGEESLKTGATGSPLPPSTVRESLPDRIGRYAIREELGKGGFAIVYLAHDTQLNRLVALKVPRPDR